jgi:hypothetical protein
LVQPRINLGRGVDEEKKMDLLWELMKEIV